MSLSSPPTGSRRLVVLIVPLVALMALSGCLGGDDDTVDLPDTTTDCAEGPGVREVHVVPGAGMPDSPVWYDPIAPDLTGIHTICWVNDDDMMHRIIAMPHNIETTPAWVLGVVADQTAAEADPHAGHGGGHDHGGDALLVFDVTFGPGARLAMPIDDTYQALSVHCHPHPWMASEWQFLPDKDLEYPTEIGHLLFRGNATGDTPAKESATSTFTVDAPNLRTVRAIVDWNDAKDDKQGLGTTLNKSDKIRVEIKDPSGEVVATNEIDKRRGPLVAEHRIPIEWPQSVKARGLAAAAEALATVAPDDTSTSGEWSVVVTVVMANGVTNLDGDTAATLDGHQEWELTFETVNEYARALSAGRTHLVLQNPTAVVPLA